MIDCFLSYDDNLQLQITSVNCHEQLKMLNMYSLQRRQYAIGMPLSTSTKSLYSLYQTHD